MHYYIMYIFALVTSTTPSTAPTTVSTSGTTILPPDDDNVVTIVISTLVGTICVMVFLVLVIRFGWKRMKQQQFDRPLTQGHTNPTAVELNMYDDSL